MSALALAGWGVAGLVGAAAWALARRSASRRAERLARACHELRGPLSVLRLGLELGSRGSGLSLQRFRAMELELGRAAQALDDLCGVRGVPGWVEIGSLLGDSVEAWRTAAGARELALDVGDLGDAFVWGERRRLAQATGNLIANAIEHGGGSIEVYAGQVGDVVRIEVTDGGAGLPVPLAELTRRGGWNLKGRLIARPRARVRSARGHGLGIVAGVVVAHGGRLLSAPSQCGARIVVELPLARVHSNAASVR